tara:strand:+ start:1179 stop:1331 length:153 start_codon:yes stop_codon:yes gene_type:complete
MDKKEEKIYRQMVWAAENVLKNPEIIEILPKGTQQGLIHVKNFIEVVVLG